MNTNTTLIAFVSLLSVAVAAPVAARCVPQTTPPLFEAVRKSDLAAVRKLLAQGTNPNALSAETGDWALHVAAAAGKLDLVRALLDKGANAGVWNREAETPRDLALKNKHTALAALLKSAEDGTYAAPPARPKAQAAVKTSKGAKKSESLSALQKLKDYRYVEQNFGYQRRW